MLGLVRFPIECQPPMASRTAITTGPGTSIGNTTTTLCRTMPTNMTSPHETPPGGTSGRLVVACGVLLAAVVVGYFALGMPGMDHGQSDTDSMSGMDHRAMIQAQADPASFETLLSNPEAVLINVHVPYAGEIAGTTRFIAFDTIASDPGLPRGKATPILLYCETGNMSSIAAAALTNAGYTNVTELTGGMQAWQASDRNIVAR